MENKLVLTGKQNLLFDLESISVIKELKGLVTGNKMFSMIERQPCTI